MTDRPARLDLTAVPPAVRPHGPRIRDFDGLDLHTGTDHDLITVSVAGILVRLTLGQASQLMANVAGARREARQFRHYLDRPDWSARGQGTPGPGGFCP